LASGGCGCPATHHDKDLAFGFHDFPALRKTNLNATIDNMMTHESEKAENRYNWCQDQQKPL
jgi:hypothetical protein